MISRHTLRRASGVLAAGGVIAYPTEGVFGLGCLPENVIAIQRILDMKNRKPDLGFVLVASSIDQLLPYLGRLGDKTMARLLAQGPIQRWYPPAPIFPAGHRHRAGWRCDACSVAWST